MIEQLQEYAWYGIALSGLSAACWFGWTVVCEHVEKLAFREFGALMDWALSVLPPKWDRYILEGSRMMEEDIPDEISESNAHVLKAASKVCARVRLLSGRERYVAQAIARFLRGVNRKAKEIAAREQESPPATK